MATNGSTVTRTMPKATPAISASSAKCPDFRNNYAPRSSVCNVVGLFHLRHRQRKVEHRSAVDLGLYPNAAAMLLHQPPANGQSRARSRMIVAVRALEDAEDVLLVLRRDA